MEPLTKKALHVLYREERRVINLSRRGVLIRLNVHPRHRGRCNGCVMRIVLLFTVMKQRRYSAYQTFHVHSDNVYFSYSAPFARNIFDYFLRALVVLNPGGWYYIFLNLISDC